MRTARDYLLEEMGIELPNKTLVSAEWFTENNLPLVVSCSCCGGTLLLPSAMIDENGTIFCQSCA